MKSKRSQPKGKHTVNRYFYSRTWDKGMASKMFNQEEVNYRLENNLPLDDLFDKLDNRYSRNKNK